MGEVPWRRITACCFLTLVLGFSIAGIIGPWWGEKGWIMTLWQIELTSSSVEYEVKWDDLCHNASNDDSGFCHRIRASRASMLLTIIFCFGALMLLMMSGASESEKSQYRCDYNAIIMANLSWFFMVVAIALSISFGVELKEKPAWGFILICVALPFGFLGMCFACCECCMVNNKKGGGNSSKWELFGQSKNGRYGGWGNWRPQRNSFRSPGGLASPQQGIAGQQGQPVASYVQGQPGHPSTVYGQNMPLTMPQAPPYQAPPQPYQAPPGPSPYGGAPPGPSPYGGPPQHVGGDDFGVSRG